MTSQTKQLTLAFEKQSQHISGLLAELHGKETALLSQGEELQRYKQEVDALKAEKEGEEKKRRGEMTVKEVEDGKQKEETQYERLVEMSVLQPNQEKESAVTFLTTNSLADSDSNAQRDAGQPQIVISDAERPTPVSDNEALWSGEPHPDSVDSHRTHKSNHDSVCAMGETVCVQDGGTADVAAELLALRQENQLLKQRIEGLMASDTSAPVLHTDSENQEVNQSQNTGHAALSCLAERSPSVPNDITSQLQNVKRSENEGGDLEKEDRRTTRAEEELEAVCPLQINRLEQQVVTVYLFISQQ